MKKLISLILLLAVLLSLSQAAFAEGVMIIAVPEQETVDESVSLDDIKLGKEFDIANFGVITVESCAWVNKLEHNPSSNYISSSKWESGAEAEYLLMIVRILNTQYNEVSFATNPTVTVKYGDGYEYGGWYRQYQSGTSNWLYSDKTSGYAIKPLYEGKYAFIATLPNYVVEHEEPLSMTVKLSEDVEFTYHFRK